MRVKTAVWMVVIGVVLDCSEAVALERATLMLSGSGCRHSQHRIIERLQGLEGVSKVEANAIPDHLLVDHDGVRRTGEELASVLNGFDALNGRCHAAVMQSCITAGFETRALRPAGTR
ncbi:MAG TPA: heavy-metal-associated domain-containing protein [Nitrospira sp.]|nr:heavy-metal-associated domain-containing protein [Nitrospira sp.]